MTNQQFMEFITDFQFKKMATMALERVRSIVCAVAGMFWRQAMVGFTA